jgi:hypothetical protein
LSGLLSFATRSLTVVIIYLLTLLMHPAATGNRRLKAAR